VSGRCQKNQRVPKAVELAKQLKDRKDRLHHLHKAKQGSKKSNPHPSKQSGDTRLIKDLKTKRDTLQTVLTKENKETAAKSKALHGLSSELQLTPQLQLTQHRNYSTKIRPAQPAYRPSQTKRAQINPVTRAFGSRAIQRDPTRAAGAFSQHRFALGHHLRDHPSSP
jgi:hypothetical protein